MRPSFEHWSRHVWRSAIAAGLLAGIGGGTMTLAASSAPAAATGDPLAPSTQFFAPPPPAAALQQVTQLDSEGQGGAAAELTKMLGTPQAVWFTGGTPHQVKIAVEATMAQAAAEHTVPVLVAYDIPGRDCAQYSAGGAVDEQAYEQWIWAFAAGIGWGKAVVLLEPDSLANLPSDCSGHGTSTYPFTDSERLAEVEYGVDVLGGHPGATTYLDGGHSAWQPVGTITQALVQAGVEEAQGFFLDVSNYQYTSNNIAYGRWVSDCIAYATAVDPGNYTNCPNQYWNGGAPGTEVANLLGSYTGVKLSPYGAWSGTTTAADLNTSGIDAAYAHLLGSTQPATHYVIDTSRNGQGPNAMSAYGASPYDQNAATVGTLASGNWCDPPGAGLGLAPTANTGVPLVDAYLWAKIPGESDGECDAAGGVRAWDYTAHTEPGWPSTAEAQSTFDPLWGQVDPAAGGWFPAEALQLAEDADQSTSSPGNA